MPEEPIKPRPPHPVGGEPTEADKRIRNFVALPESHTGTTLPEYREMVLDALCDPEKSLPAPRTREERKDFIDLHQKASRHGCEDNVEAAIRRWYETNPTKEGWDAWRRVLWRMTQKALGLRPKEGEQSPKFIYNEPEPRDPKYEQLAEGEDRVVIDEDDGVIQVEVPFATVDGRCNYGGPGSKYTFDNEDSMFVARAPDGSLVAAVIDGAGGSGDGLLASEVTCLTVCNEVVKGATFESALRAAHDAVYKNGEGKYPRPCSAGVFVHLDRSAKAEVGFAGDTQALTFRKGSFLEPGSTHPKNVAWDLMLHGLISEREYFSHPNRNVLTSSIGTRNHSEFTLQSFQAEEGDIIVLMSDGVNGCVSRHEIGEIVRRFPDDPRKIQERIYRLAFMRNNSEEAYTIQVSPAGPDVATMEPSIGVSTRDDGSQRNYFRGDNITVLVIRVGKLEKAAAV